MIYLVRFYNRGSLHPLEGDCVMPKSPNPLAPYIERTQKLEEQRELALKDEASAVCLLRRMIGMCVSTGKIPNHPNAYFDVTVHIRYLVFLFDSGFFTEEDLRNYLRNSYHGNTSPISGGDDDRRFWIFFDPDHPWDMSISHPERGTLCFANQGKISFDVPGSKAARKRA